MSNEGSDRGYNFSIEPQHTSHNTRIIGRDCEIVRRQVWEAMCSVGITTYFYKCLSDKGDFYQDPNCMWAEGILLDCIFEDTPKIKLLKEYGWFTEDEEIRPQIIYLPIYSDWTTKEILDVTVNSLVKVNYFGQVTPSEFRITDKKMDSVYGCYYICKLAPERMECFEEVDKDGYKFLKVRDSEPCNHEIENNKVAEENGGEYPDLREYHHNNYDDYNSLLLGKD